MADEKFELVSSYQPTGDQPQAIETLVKGVERGDRCQTTAQVLPAAEEIYAAMLCKCNRPTLVPRHNKNAGGPALYRVRSFF